ncbi:MAG: stage III sporulation protein AG [Lachnospiraceae bacterium]
MEKDGKKKISIKEIGLPKIILMAVAGILLLVLSMPQKQESQIEEEGRVEVTENDAYIEAMEKKLENTLRTIDGVGKVEVMLTLESSKEAVLNKDIQTEQEKMKDDTKSDNIIKENEETVLTENSGNQQPYIIKEIEPKVAGAVVVLEGGGNPVIVKEVTEAVQVLFHLEVNKIKVLKMEEGK